MTNRILIRLPLVAALAAGLSSAAMAQPMERARAAQARGDLRTAQIELRNAVRDNPRSAEARAALAAASLDLGDGTTAEKEARAALEMGLDRVAGTALLLRALLLQAKYQDLLRDFPSQPESPALGGQVAAARALAQIALSRPDEATASVQEALRLAPAAVEPHLAAAALAAARGDRAGSEAETDRVLAIDPNSPDGLLRKGTLLMIRGETREAAEVFGRLLTQRPGNVPARLRRAEAWMQLGDEAAARRDVDATLATLPGNGPGTYLRATLLARAGDWRAADEDIQRLGALLTSFPDGYLLQAITKRALGQNAVAEDSARRHVARRPEDPRGVKLLAAMEMETGRPADAAATLNRFVGREGIGAAADAEIFDLLGRAQSAARRPREAMEALARAAALAPDNRNILNRLAAARLAAGDAAGATEAAGRSLELEPAQPAMREMLAAAALIRGDLATATAELERLDASGQRGEAAGVTEGTLRLTRLDLQGARESFTGVLRDHPESVAGRLGLARVASAEGAAEETEKLLGEVLQRQPANPDALASLSLAARPGGPRAAQARAVLEAAQAASPGEPMLALTLADLMLRSGEAAQAVTLLESEPLKPQARSIPMLIARAEALAAAGRLDDAREAGRTALAADPSSIEARMRFAMLTARAGDARSAETIVQEGLRATPGDARLQQTLVALVLQARGVDAALAVADRLAAQPSALPAAATLRGDVIASTNRMEDAARAYAAAQAQSPSLMLALRQAAAFRAAGKPAEAAAALRGWLERTPDDPAALATLASLDIEAGRLAEAEARLSKVVERAPNDAATLNNLAWVLQRRGGDGAARARGLAERAYALNANADTADTLGWILARGGDAQLGVPLLRQSVAARAAAQRPDPAASWRLAYALKEAGQRDEALSVLTPVLAAGTAFPERAEAERLLADLRAGR
jgi:putative PEP-CTERM system TPR-repeat lipoprotein